MCRRVLIVLFSCVNFRVDPDCISPDVKNAIHVGDKILEINGTPIHNVPLDEVETAFRIFPLTCCSCFSEKRAGFYFLVFAQSTLKFGLHVKSLFFSRSTCSSRRPAGCCSSPSNMTLTLRREARRRPRIRWTASCSPRCWTAPAPPCRSRRPPTLTSAT